MSSAGEHTDTFQHFVLELFHNADGHRLKAKVSAAWQEKLRRKGRGRNTTHESNSLRRTTASSRRTVLGLNRLSRSSEEIA